MTPTDLNLWRADTPACGRRTHLNNAGAALMPRPVLQAVERHLRLEVELGGYEAEDAAAEMLHATYEEIARLCGTKARNIAMVESATTAFSQALSAFDFETGATLVTTRNDYISNQLMYLSLSRRTGLQVLRADDQPEGGVDPASIRALIRRHRPTLVAVSWIPTNSGLVQPVEAIGKICAEEAVPYLVDACQAVGQMPVDVSNLRCDFLAATARKFLRGPRGVGFLVVSDRMLQEGRYPLLVDMRGARWIDADTFEPVSSARRFETWEHAWALVLGLGAAAGYASTVGLATVGLRGRQLAGYTRQRLSKLPGARVLDRGQELCAIATASFDGRDAFDLMAALRQRDINVSAAARDSAIIDMDDKNATSLLRVSPHYYNTEEEIDTLVEALAEMLRDTGTGTGATGVDTPSAQ